jgi:hypothetical protein
MSTTPPAGSNDPTGNPHPPKDPPPTPALEIAVPQIPGTHWDEKTGRTYRDKPTGDDGDVKKYQNSQGHEGAL